MRDEEVRASDRGDEDRSSRHVHRLGEEQAALRRVATLVARGTAPEELFAAVAEEVVRLLPVEYAALGRYESDRTMTAVGAGGTAADAFPIGTRASLGGRNIGTIVFETGRPARIDGFADSSGPLSGFAREKGVRSAVGTPITVEGRLWGMIAAGSTVETMPADTEARLASFTELLATAIANAESRAGLARLAEEQAALRRVATLVARSVPSKGLFAAVTEEVGKLLSIDYAGLARYETGTTLTFIAAWTRTGVAFPGVASRWPLGGRNVATLVFETGRPARVDRYADASGEVGDTAREIGFRSSVGTPIVVEGSLWGVVIAGSTVDRPLPADTEARLASFTELVATALANTESRAGLARLAEEQAALRRVATLVAYGGRPEGLFAAATEEVGQLLPAEFSIMGRYELDDAVTCMAAWGPPVAAFPVGSRWGLEGENLITIIRDTGRPARVDRFAHASGPLGEAGRLAGFHSAVGAPIVVAGRLWGVMAVGSTLNKPLLPVDTEARLASFTELLATAIANAESRAELTASRARVVAAADETRRRIERDLHDGAQQRLVSLMLELRAASAAERPDVGELLAQLERTERGLAAVLDELREISRGIHPAILSRGGLGPALRALARRSAVPVELDVRTERRLAGRLEAAAYYIVSEALTNAAKHAQASVVSVELDTQEAVLRVAIRDDGIGGADLGKGSGLVGLSDRIEALGGSLRLTSATGDGTTVSVEIPIDGEPGA